MGGTTMTCTRLWGLLVALALGGCVLTSATGYEPAGSDGGYSELQLGPDLFRIAFQGNPYTSQERVADLALLRISNCGSRAASRLLPSCPSPTHRTGTGTGVRRTRGSSCETIAPSWRSGCSGNSRSRASRPIRPRCFARSSAAGTRWTGSDLVG